MSVTAVPCWHEPCSETGGKTVLWISVYCLWCGKIHKTALRKNGDLGRPFFADCEHKLTLAVCGVLVDPVLREWADEGSIPGRDLVTNSERRLWAESLRHLMQEWQPEAEHMAEWTLLALSKDSKMSKKASSILHAKKASEQ